MESVGSSDSSLRDTNLEEVEMVGSFGQKVERDNELWRNATARGERGNGMNGIVDFVPMDNGANVNFACETNLEVASQGTHVTHSKINK